MDSFLSKALPLKRESRGGGGWERREIQTEHRKNLNIQTVFLMSHLLLLSPLRGQFEYEQSKDKFITFD